MRYRHHRIRLLAFLIVGALGTTVVGLQYVGLDRYLWNKPIYVRANAAQAGGIFPNAEVTYRGVAIGRVDAVELHDDGVSIVMALNPDSHVPRDVRAVVQNRSAIGEQYVDLQPQHVGAPYLADGDAIPREDTDIPPRIEDVLLRVQELVESVDKRALRTVLSEIGVGLRGLGPELKVIADETDNLVDSLNTALPDTREVLVNGRTILGTQRDTSGALRAWARDLDLVVGEVARADGSVRSLMTETAQTAPEIIDLIGENDQQLPLLMKDFLSLAGIVRARIDGVRVFLVAFPRLIQDTFNVVQGDGYVHFNVALDYSSGVCTSEGYSGTVKSVQAEPVKELGNPQRRANLNAYCAEPPGSGTTVRGSQNVPLLAGDTYNPATQEVDNPRQGKLGFDDVPARSYERDKHEEWRYSPGSVVLNQRTGVVSGPDGPLLVLGNLDSSVESKLTSWRDLLIGSLGSEKVS
ncbi:MlaD family protein [Nocardioides stalactiti]|uniref:MlaD family protein n=1 Tax=Nocardioides stalactiti TaxID=2755356 RepID=UPI001602CCB7|nr:MlaD family protein [Nocardioides stalactiti]